MKFKLLNNYFFASAILNSISQIMLIESPFIGILFLIAIGFFSLKALLALLLGACIGTLIGLFHFQESEKTVKGLNGYNAALSALAIAVFLDMPFWWGGSILSAGMTTYFQYLLAPWFEKRKIPIFTFPFVAISWGWILIIHHFHWHIEATEIVFHPQDFTQELIYALTLPFHQVFFGESRVSGGLIMLGILFAGRHLFFKTLCCTLFCCVIWYLLGVDIQFFHQGLFGFNPVLVGLALAVFLPSARFWKLIPFASLLCIWLQIILTDILNLWQLPAFTFPFVLTTWIVLGLNQLYDYNRK
ncbi:hypothetical protein A6B43_04275 [Vespertiliibacter pulmonis]|uniref:Urea transporter n=1 Tax=Vespertiliibacter pulmonis TaxID=1443036 RepID=A0A3N4VWF8_9PAST|nr:urea transporter [Vespertiliibacter pulmonis]QLB20792.1 hypothetical protein A6B43_04275 [Vespertiliibacter pulmonis]RPE83441.1 urea transporter [Vespertiliibacter pulmonis]